MTEQQQLIETAPPIPLRPPVDLSELRCVSMYQFWAGLVWINSKLIETRSWDTQYRGWIAIQASKRITALAREYYPQSPTARELLAQHFSVRRIEELGSMPLGCIGAVAYLSGTKEVITDNPHDIKIADHYKTDGWQEFGIYKRGRFLWLLDNVHRLKEPVPCRGYQGIWTLDAEIIAQVETQL